MVLLNNRASLHRYFMFNAYDRRTWAVLVIAVVLTLVNLGTRCDVAYSPVIVWALAGIVYKQMAEPLIPYAAGLGALMIIAG